MTVVVNALCYCGLHGCLLSCRFFLIFWLSENSCPCVFFYVLQYNLCRQTENNWMPGVSNYKI